MLTIECTVNKCEYHRILPTHSYIYDIPNKNRYKTERIKPKRLTQKLNSDQQKIAQETTSPKILQIKFTQTQTQKLHRISCRIIRSNQRETQT